MSAIEVPDIELRQATLGDADTLAVLMAEMDDDEPQHKSVFDGKRVRETLVEMTRYPDFRAYLLLAGSVAVGSFSLMIFSSPSHQGARQAVLDAVVVTRAQRGAGLGKAMIKRALEIAAAAGCYKMSLPSNLKRVDAHRFYERLGFRQHGISFSIPLTAATS